jgi:hypothetical protein
MHRILRHSDAASPAAVPLPGEVPVQRGNLLGEFVDVSGRIETGDNVVPLYSKPASQSRSLCTSGS